MSMRKRFGLAAALGLAALCLGAAPGLADGRGHGGGRGHGHGSRSGVVVGINVGPGYWPRPARYWRGPAYYPAYAYPYYSGYYGSYGGYGYYGGPPVVYAPQPVIIEQPAPVYIERDAADAAPAPPTESYWYYCPSRRGYYPTVPSCPEPWLKVAADER